MMLDITDSKLKGELLVTEIMNRVKDTQSLIVKDYPSVIKMTKDQQDDVAKYLYIGEMLASDLQFIKTPLNVMEIELAHP